MAAPSVVMRDGVEIEETSAMVDIGSPMWRSGQSLFETLLVRDVGRYGLYLEERHATRLRGAAEALGWSGCPDASELAATIRHGAELFRARCSGCGRLRLTVAWTRADGSPEVYLSVTPYDVPQDGVRVWPTNICVPWPEQAHVPKSGNRVAYDLAHAEAEARGAEEALLVDSHGRPIEGARSNLFAITGSLLVTPPIGSGILAGVTRERILHLAEACGLTTREEYIDLPDLGEADSLFMTNALWGVRPVESVGGRSLDQKGDGLSRVNQAFRNDVERYILGHASEEDS